MNSNSSKGFKCKIYLGHLDDVSNESQYNPPKKFPKIYLGHLDMDDSNDISHKNNKNNEQNESEESIPKYSDWYYDNDFAGSDWSSS